MATRSSKGTIPSATAARPSRRAPDGARGPVV